MSYGEVRGELQTVIAKPYLFTRSQQYYLRIRMRGAKISYSVSLGTTDEQIAEAIENEVMICLSEFHLANPSSTWEEIQEQLKQISKECRARVQGDPTRLVYDMLHGTSALDRNRVIELTKAVLSAAQEHLLERPEMLMGLIDLFNSFKNTEKGTPKRPDKTVKARRAPTEEAITWQFLSTRYLDERRSNVKPITISSLQSNYKAIQQAFRAIKLSDLRLHTRSDLIALRTKLLSTRKPSTVNTLLTQLTSVLKWAVENDYLEKTYTSRLLLTKGVGSSRGTFAREQVVLLMTHVNQMPDTAWQRWALSLLAITGARVGEIAQLTAEDVKEIGGCWCIHIHENGPDRSIKNKFSARTIPVIDGALGFDLEAFLEAVDGGFLASSQKVKPKHVSGLLGLILKSFLGENRAATQTLHSLRHHLASSMKSSGVPLAHAQAILGHASGTITYDDYGSEVPVAVLARILKAEFIKH